MTKAKPKPQCVVCGQVLPKFTNPNRDPIVECLTADGDPPRWGGHGDNLVCTNACGRVLAVQIVRTVPGVLDLLPVEIRADLRAPPGAGETDNEQFVARHVAVRRRAERTNL